MTLTLKKKLFSLLLIGSLASAFLPAAPVKADASDADVDRVFWGNKQAQFESNVDLQKNKDPRELAAQVINIALGFLGLVVVLLLLYAGFMWMTAAGDAAKVDKAKSLITASIIGIIIILSAFAISQFVLRAIYGATQS